MDGNEKIGINIKVNCQHVTSTCLQIDSAFSFHGSVLSSIQQRGMTRRTDNSESTGLGAKESSKKQLHGERFQDPKGLKCERFGRSGQFPQHSIEHQPETPPLIGLHRRLLFREN